MCGIIGYVGSKECSDFILSGLKLLEYRGYDSVGLACYSNGKFNIVKTEGKITNIEGLLEKTPLKGSIGLGHTRWATHGKPNSINAHPHRTGKTVLVHNGIIENYEEIRDELLEKGYQMVSETDSELFGHLVEDQMKAGLEFLEAVRTAFIRLRGSCSIVIVHDDYPDLLVAVRNGTPLVAAYSKESGGALVASDAQGLIAHSQNVTFLEDGDLVICRKDHFDVFNVQKPLKNQKPLERKATFLDWTVTSMQKEGFPHFMLKEIFEQPRSLIETLDTMMHRDSGVPFMEDLDRHLHSIENIHIVACGTAWHAALVGKYLIESSTRIPVLVDLASEYRYRNPIIDGKTLFLAISQSGETADTLAALREVKFRGAKTALICNVRGSSLAREADMTWFTAAGPEIGVASTKAFTTQILMTMLLAQYISFKKNNHKPYDAAFFSKLPHLVQSVLNLDAQIKNIAKKYLNSKGFIYIGRGALYPIALEGALKMKEISYVHAEGYPAGELKHGPIAIVDSDMCMVVLAPRDRLYEKNISNLQEVRARGGKILSIGSKGDEQLRNLSQDFIELEFSGDWSDTILASIPLQLLAYHTAVLKGTDVDKPRNLAKSVTVE